MKICKIAFKKFRVAGDHFGGLNGYEQKLPPLFIGYVNL